MTRDIILFGVAVIFFSALTCLIMLAERQRLQPASRHRCRYTVNEFRLEASELAGVAGMWLLGFYVLAADAWQLAGVHVGHALAWAPLN